MKDFYKKQKEFIEYVLMMYGSKDSKVREFEHLYEQKLVEKEKKVVKTTKKQKTIKLANITQRLIVDALTRNREYDLSKIKKHNEKQKIIDKLKEKM